MPIPLHPARVHIVKQGARYFVHRIDLANSARNGHVTFNDLVRPDYATRRELKTVKKPSLVSSGFIPATYRLFYGRTRKYRNGSHNGAELRIRPNFCRTFSFRFWLGLADS